MISKKLIPKSLFNRFLLIILIPSLILQITVIYVFYFNHINNVNKHLAASMSSQIYLIYQSYQSNQNTKLTSDLLKKIDIDVKIIPNVKINSKYNDYGIKKFLGFVNLFPTIDSSSYLKTGLNSKDIDLFLLYPSLDKNRIILDIQMKKDILRLDLPKKRITTNRREAFIAWLIMMSVITALISLLFIKNQIKSIKDLKKNAQKLGIGMDVVNFKIQGASEIRSLGISLIRMKERINRQINQRTLMLSGVSHDLRTLLTRMKLQIALMKKNENTLNLEKDISDMEIMINEYLDFSKGNQSEQKTEIFVKTYFDDIINSYQSIHKNINYNNKVGKKIKINFKVNNFKRAIRNIVDNAIKYSKNNIYISIKKLKNNIIITIEDDGPGISEDKIDQIFKPFYRLDSSRNLDIIGTGLGLSISRDIISSHGGQISASRSSYKGLCIKIILPI